MGGGIASGSQSNLPSLPMNKVNGPNPDSNDGAFAEEMKIRVVSCSINQLINQANKNFI